jgi:hypothetical protein
MMGVLVRSPSWGPTYRFWWPILRLGGAESTVRVKVNSRMLLWELNPDYTN